MPKLSIIIPVYNTEAYLQRCLESVYNQTLSDLEVICINDNSLDNSLEILKNYNAVIINLEQNQGAANARNIGIIHATGDYIAFLDSDDFVELDFYEKLYNKAIETKADIIKGAYKLYDERYVDPFINEKISEDKTNFCCEYCSAIFKREFIVNNNIKFPNLIDMEDPVFALQAAILANKIEIVKEAYVNICSREDSQTSGIPSIERIKSKLVGLELLINLASENVSYESYGYIFSLWFSITYNNSSKNNDVNSRIYLANRICELFKKLKYPDEIKLHSEDLELAIKNYDINKLVFLPEISRENELLLKIDKLKNVFNEYNKLYKDNVLQVSDDEIVFVSVVNDYKIYEEYYINNRFIKSILNPIDNIEENKFITKRYNEFLDKFDYNNPKWIIFSHPDWEVLEDLNSKLNNLDKDSIYGSAGAGNIVFHNKYLRRPTGFCLEQGKCNISVYGSYNKQELTDTLDCQCLIVHSTLIEKYGLRFDENLKWDLYTEDFCINAKLNYEIKSYTIPIKCIHHSDASFRKIPYTYYEMLDYMHNKYPEAIFASSVTMIGKKKYETLSAKEVMLYELREKIKGNN